MRSRGLWTVATFVCAMAPASLYAQQFSIGKVPVQVHGFMSQGFAKTHQNNFLTMKTEDGSAALTDAGVNASAKFGRRLLVGGQVYVRNIGNLGNGGVNLDWAQADLRLWSWLSVRGGKVKTVMGLYNDTQDMEFLQTFALLPQSVYPLDMRDGTISHLGGDLYGRIDVAKGGALVYTGYVGRRRDTKHGGYPYLLRGVGINFDEYGGRQVGGDLRWQARDYQMGASYMRGKIKGTGWFDMTLFGLPGQVSSYEEHSNNDFTTQFYGQYAAGRVKIDAEHRRYYRDQQIINGLGSVMTDLRAWYIAGAYRVASYLELGSYYSRSTVAASNSGFDPPIPATRDHVYDKVVSARFDIHRMIAIKVEGHFMDGFGNVGMYPDGFYAVDNPQGLKPKTNLLVTRIGFNF